MAILLIDVDPKDGEHLATLYDFLAARLQEPGFNISHKSLPGWQDHVAFVRSEPYAAWYLIASDDPDNAIVGAVYLTKADEVGIWIASEYRGMGIGRKALNELMVRNPRARYLANINPANIRSQQFFAKNFNATTIQLTMEIINVDRR